MHKRARARRQLLTSPGDHQPVEMAEPPSFLSPVSSCARKLDIALQRWGDSPGVPQAPDTNRAGLGAMFGAAHAWPSGPAAETNTPAIGPGAFAASSSPFSADPGPFARPDIDTRPIRSEQGLTFAEMLAVNANPDAGGGTFLTQPWLRRRKRSDFEPRVHVSFSADDCPDGSRAETRTKSFFLPRYERSASRSRNLVADDIYTYLSTTLRRRRRRRRTRVRQTQSRRDAWRAPGARARFVPLGSPLALPSEMDGREGERRASPERRARGGGRVYREAV